MTAEITSELLSDLEAKADEARGGPWVDSYCEAHHIHHITSPGQHPVADVAINRNAPFIAAANPETVKALIARVRELEEQVRAVRELCLLLDYDAVYDLKSDIIHIIGSVL